MPRGFPGGTPSSSRQTRPAVTGWWKGTPFLPCISFSPRLVVFLSLVAQTPPCIVSLPTPRSLYLKFLRIVFPPSFLPLFQLLSVRLSISSFLFSRFLPGHLISLQSRLLSCPFSFPLGLHFLRVVFPPSLFLFSPLLWVGLSPFSLLFSHFLWVGLPISLFLFSQFLWVGFLPLPDSFPLSTFRCLPLSNSFGTRPALNVTCRGLPPLKSIDIHLTLSTSQRGQHYTQVSNTLPFLPSLSSLGIQSLPILIPPALQKLSTFLWILVRHRDKRHTHPLTPSPSL